VKIASCKPYDARVVERREVSLNDGKSKFKVYFVSIAGRDNPAAYEWAHCGVSPAEFLASFRGRTIAGVGFVTAFPHITKIFRFAPSVEILLHVAACRTGDWAPIPLEREEGYTEYACLAEAAIAADEYAMWARADTVDAYLGQWSDWSGGAIRDPGKLNRYWG